MSSELQPLLLLDRCKSALAQRHLTVKKHTKPSTFPIARIPVGALTSSFSLYTIHLYQLTPSTLKCIMHTKYLRFPLCDTDRILTTILKFNSAMMATVWKAEVRSEYVQPVLEGLITISNSLFFGSKAFWDWYGSIQQELSRGAMELNDTEEMVRRLRAYFATTPYQPMRDQSFFGGIQLTFELVSPTLPWPRVGIQVEVSSAIRIVVGQFIDPEDSECMYTCEEYYRRARRYLKQLNLRWPECFAWVVFEMAGITIQCFVPFRGQAWNDAMERVKDYYEQVLSRQSELLRELIDLGKGMQRDSEAEEQKEGIVVFRVKNKAIEEIASRCSCTCFKL